MRDMRLSGFEEAVRLTQDRLADPVFDTVAAALVMSHRVGGRNLSTVLEGLGRSVRQAVQVEREVRAEQAKNVLSARIIASLPVVLILAIRGMNPDYLDVFSTPDRPGTSRPLPAQHDRRLRRHALGDAPSGQRKGHPMTTVLLLSGMLGAGLWLIVTATPLGRPRPDLALRLRAMTAQGRTELEAASRRIGAAAYSSRRFSSRCCGRSSTTSAVRSAACCVRFGIASGNVEQRLALAWPGVTPSQFYGQKLGQRPPLPCPLPADERLRHQPLRPLAGLDLAGRVRRSASRCRTGCCRAGSKAAHGGADGAADGAGPARDRRQRRHVAGAGARRGEPPDGRYARRRAAGSGARGGPRDRDAC